MSSKRKITESRQPSGRHHYTFSPHHKPIAEVYPGEKTVIYTKDSFEDKINSEDINPSDVLGRYLNPQTGPIYIKGAEPGDTLAVYIHSIEPTRDWAVSAMIPYFGGLTCTQTTRTLNDPLPEKVWIYKLENGILYHNERLRFPWEPFMGTMGVAPDVESLSTLTPHSHGGNMDVPDVCPGNTIYFPVKTEGALFYTGDGHGNQGQGELGGAALEISTRVTVSFDLIKAKVIEWPRIESEEEIMAVGSARPMEDAARIAYAELLFWLVEDYGFEKFEAYQFLTQAGKLYVGNMVDTYYSLVAKVRKDIL